MPQLNARICLSMIVKNEAPVICRCLESLRPLIDASLVVGTGSSDGTQGIVREAMNGIPGDLYERPWLDFAHNRSEALQLAKGRGDYVFVIDADETLEWPEHFVLPTLTADAYSLTLHYGDLSYHRVCLLRDALPWRYRSVLHEYLEAEGHQSTEHVQGPVVRVRAEGARSRNPRKFHHDAAVLERALHDEPNNTRYQFYLAQSYRDAGESALALQHYRKSIGMGGWDEEIWYAQFQVACLLERTSAEPGAITQAYLAAYQLRPTRAEALVELARYHRLRNKFALALLYARPAAELKLPSDRLFLDAACYAWRALDELSIAAWWTKTLGGAAAASKRLLREARNPESERSRIQANAKFYRGAGYSID
jgi:tetratricopeptide (TPR) repeat protein